MNDSAVQPPAGLVRRVLARLIDVALLIAIGAFIGSLVGRTVPGGGAPMAMEFPANLVLSAAAFTVYVGYEVAFTALSGATPGKLALGLRVVAAGDPIGRSGSVHTRDRAAESHGATSRADSLSVLTRSGVLYASVLFNFVPVIGFLALLVSVYAVVSSVTDRPQHRGLHDKLGGTMVLGERARSVPS